MDFTYHSRCNYIISIIILYPMITNTIILLLLQLKKCDEHAVSDLRLWLVHLFLCSYSNKYDKICGRCTSFDCLVFWQRLFNILTKVVYTYIVKLAPPIQLNYMTNYYIIDLQQDMVACLLCMSAASLQSHNVMQSGDEYTNTCIYRVSILNTGSCVSYSQYLTILNNLTMHILD